MGLTYKKFERSEGSKAGHIPSFVVIPNGATKYIPQEFTFLTTLCRVIYITTLVKKMKTTTIGRIGAIVAGAAMLGTAVASALAGAQAAVPSNLDKGFFLDSNMSPNVQVVVGEKAQASDGAAAGQIAAIIGNMAFKTVSTTGSGGTMEVDGGTTTCTPSDAECAAGNAEGQVTLSWDAIGMVGELQQKQMNCSIYSDSDGLLMTDLDDGGD